MFSLLNKCHFTVSLFFCVTVSISERESLNEDFVCIGHQFCPVGNRIGDETFLPKFMYLSVGSNTSIYRLHFSFPVSNSVFIINSVRMCAINLELLQYMMVWTLSVWNSNIHYLLFQSWSNQWTWLNQSFTLVTANDAKYILILQIKFAG